MSKWWRKVQASLPKPSSLKKTASENVSFAKKTYSEDMSKRARNLSAELGKQARERAEEAASRLAGRAKALPSKAAEVRAGEKALKTVRERQFAFLFLLNCTAAVVMVFKVRHNWRLQRAHVSRKTGRAASP